MKPSISIQTLRRLPQYLNFLKTLPADGPQNISATAIAQGMGINDVQVRKDLAAVSNGGRPKIGYITEELIRDIECFLGFDAVDSAVLVGAGNLGKALLSYNGFQCYGLEILAAFDTDEALTETTHAGRKILPLSKLPGLCRRLKVGIGIITVPAQQAQGVCDLLIESGVRAIWNFAPVHLRVPPGVLVQNENMAVSLAVLSKHLSEQLQEC